MFEIEFNHFDYRFRCVAEGYEDVSCANVSCYQLRADIRELSAKETRELHLALILSDAAYANDPIWESPALQRLFEMQNAGRIAGLQDELGGLDGENMCRCRLVPAVD